MVRLRLYNIINNKQQYNFIVCSLKFQKKFNDQIIDFTVEVMANTTIHISTLTVKNVTMNDLGFYKCSIFDFNKKEIGFAHRQIFKKGTRL